MSQTRQHTNTAVGIIYSPVGPTCIRPFSHGSVQQTLFGSKASKFNFPPASSVGAAKFIIKLDLFSPHECLRAAVITGAHAETLEVTEAFPSKPLTASGELSDSYILWGLGGGIGGKGGWLQTTCATTDLRPSLYLAGRADHGAIDGSADLTCGEPPCR